MAVDNLQILEFIDTREAFLERQRPPENIRPQLDITYKIDGQSIIIHEIRPFLDDSPKIICTEVAKTTFVLSPPVCVPFLIECHICIPFFGFKQIYQSV